MSIRRFVIDVAAVFSVTLVVAMAVSALGNLIAHNPPAIDWEMSVRLAIALGILVPWIRAGRRAQRSAGPRAC